MLDCLIKVRIPSSSKFIIYLYQILLLFDIIIVETPPCSRYYPIEISNECTLEYCEQEKFDSGYCVKNNSIIKTQWLNNIIVIGELNYRYINFASYSNEDMVIETNSYPGSYKRIYYGLKQNGRPLFINRTNGEETTYYSITVENEEKKR